MDKILIRQEDWIKYADLVGDFNQVHRDSVVAREYGFRDVIAPGMFVASHVGKYGPVSSISGITFSGEVYDGAELVVESSEVKRGIDYVFFDGERKVCEVRGVALVYGDEYDSLPKDLKSVEYTYNSSVDLSTLEEFLEAVGVENGAFNPVMYLASLSAPALLSYGAKRGLEGIHATQSFGLHAPVDLSSIDVVIGNEKYRSLGGVDMVSYDLRWVQGDEVIGSGRSMVVPIEKARGKV